MREVIIDETIRMLKNEGLKFKIDNLSKKLKISKKTFYKFFESKEELAFEVYKAIYTDIINNLEALTNKDIINKEDIYKFIYLYVKAIFFNHDEIFKQYTFIENLRVYVNEELNIIWSLFEKLVKNSSYKETLNNYYLKEIITGSLERISNLEIFENACHEFVDIIFKDNVK